MIVLEYILLVGVIVCAIAAPLCKRPLASVLVYMALSLMMAVLWSLLQSPDLAITEAAVGAGVTSILNLSAVHLSVPAPVVVRPVDLATEIQILAVHAGQKGPR